MRRALGAILAASALLASPHPATGQAAAPGPCGRPSDLPLEGPINVELTTVTDTQAVVTWLTCSGGAPSNADTTVTYGPIGGGSSTLKVIGNPTPYHYARLTGLKPGTEYQYSVLSNDRTSVPDRSNPGRFTTLTRPGGRELFRFAVVADIHIGEEVSGLATSTPAQFPPGYSNDLVYPSRMLEGAVDNLNAKRVSLTLAPADNSTHGELLDLYEARRILDLLRSDYLVARGAHDRPNQYDLAASECYPDGDCFRATFRSEVPFKEEPQHLPKTVVKKGWAFIALDSVNLASGMGELAPDQLEWLRQELDKAAKAKQPVVITFHHPVAEYSSTAAIPPAVFGVNQPDAQAFLQLIGGYDVRMVINSHTHRNWIAYSPHTGRMPIIEVGPVKEYPAGFTLVRVFTKGLIREWWPIDCEFCNMWRETTKAQYLTLYPLYTFGSLRDRNFVHRFDAPDVPGIPSIPLGIWPPLLPAEA